MQVLLSRSWNFKTLPGISRAPVQKFGSCHIVLPRNIDLPVPIDHKLRAPILECFEKKLQEVIKKKHCTTTTQQIVMFLYSKQTNCIKDNVLLLQEYSEKTFSNMSYYCANKDKINAFFVVFYNSVSHCAPCHFCSENHMLERSHTRLCSNLDSFCCYQSLWCVWLRTGS